MGDPLDPLLETVSCAWCGASRQVAKDLNMWTCPICGGVAIRKAYIARQVEPN